MIPRLSLLKQRAPRLYASLRTLHAQLRLIIWRLISATRIGCALYYLLMNASFRREQYAVVKGLVRYHRQTDRDAIRYKLRRNIHRLEKGLLMRPRKPVFALDYIAETVDAYLALRSQTNEGKGDRLSTWAHDVLCEFFASVQTNDYLESLRRRLEETGWVDPQGEKKPYLQGALGPLAQSVSYDQLEQLTRSRRSVRWFLDRPVEREKIEAALAIAVQAPSSCNRQPFLYRVFDDPDLAETLFTLPLGTRGFGKCAPVVIAVTGDLSAYFDERDRHGIYIDASLSIMSFLTALQTLGLGSCTINWPDVERRERRIERFLGLKPYERVVMLLLTGYPDPERHVAYSEKTAVRDVVIYNATGEDAPRAT
ncbi:nitroreductase family protein [Flagellatimonas centrodinii]|uniref:nitroreductase family protein n=1 Tax=Flagellatimonas centrodinii TaxID=2806210 RepID=UPI001FF8CD56|nr:nitroreductase family protein [Flagellatimonas centrodinii]ULQ46623.1 nitroreductase family protein [Flagellatimonas centrodinii]